MLFYLAILSAEIFFWWRIKSDFLTGPVKTWHLVRSFKIILTLILLLAFIKIMFIRDDIDLPKNAFSLIFFGAVAAMTLSAGLFYGIFSLIRLLMIKTFKKPLSWLKWTITSLTAIIIALFFYGYTFGRLSIKTEKKDITFDYADKRIDGMKIALISDMHLSSFKNHYNRLLFASSEINVNRPDIVINTGDFVSYGWQEFGKCDTILRKVRAPLGSFAISGNHDDCSYNTSIDIGQRSEGSLIVDSLIRMSGYTLLNDTSATVVYNGAKVTIAGIRTTGHRLDISYGDESKALSGVGDSTFLIFLVHDPAYWGEDDDISEKADLTLSGHTHGMQVGVPLLHRVWSPASLFHKYWAGLYESDGHFLYVNRGLGCMAMAERIFMPPEITILTIHCK